VRFVVIFEPKETFLMSLLCFKLPYLIIV
jgi:hypothetical protein